MAEPGKKTESVQVVVRCRPLSSQERKDRRQQVVKMESSMGRVLVRNPEPKKDAPARDPPKQFTYDATFDETCSQARVYEETARGIVESVMAGYNGTVFAYGQTGTGKTFTMEGDLSRDEYRGVIPRAFDDVFTHVGAGGENVQFLVRVSFLEIYQDAVLDLLAAEPAGRGLHDAQDKLQLKEHPDSGVFVQGLTTEVVHSADEMMRVLERGKTHRKTGATKMNLESSRSHCIFTVTVEVSELGADEQQHIRVGKLNMVDLAGSERLVKTGAEGTRKKEAVKINLSLAALGNVISALTSSRKAGHIPYRDSKLTRLLQDSLGGNTKTVMIANIGPADYNYDETINTLRFANRAKHIENKPTVNEDPKDTMLRECQNEIERLRKRLESAPAGPDGTVYVDKVVQKVVVNGMSEEQLRRMEEEAAEKRSRVQEQLEREREELMRAQAQAHTRTAEMREALEQKEQQLEQAAQSKAQLAERLRAVEANLVSSNEMLSVADRERQQLRLRKMELEQKRLEAERVQRKLKQKEALQAQQSERYQSQDDELEAKTRKLDELRSRYQQVKQEIEDVQAANQREREDLLEAIREVTRAIQLKDLILEHFVPLEEHEKVAERAVWDSGSNQWLLAPINMEALNATVRRPASARRGHTRPICDASLAALQAGDPNPRYRRDNIVELALDMPERTTEDFELAYDGDGMDDGVVYDDEPLGQDVGAVGGGVAGGYDPYGSAYAP